MAGVYQVHVSLIDSAFAEYYSPMTKAEILEELPKLTDDERQEIRRKLTELDVNEWLDADDPLTADEKALLEARLADIEAHPEKSIPWEEAKKRLEARFGK
jgi:putative addiction module component (TIGR02574 family)